MFSMRVLRIGSIVLALLLGVLIGWKYFGLRTSSGSYQGHFQSVLLYPSPREIKPFILQRAEGGQWTQANFLERWTLVFFGFTHCPDVCPTTLAVMKQIEDQLPKQDKKLSVQMLFVSVDPERDQGQTLKEYTQYFSPNIKAATAGQDELEKFTRQLGVVYMKSPLPSGDYTIDHSSQMVLIDPRARMAGLFRPPFDVSSITADLVALSDQ
jgi:protein SCO1/2